MEHPRRITKAWFTESHHSRAANWFISGSGLHPNPRMYKYDWWIYPSHSPYESAEEIFFKSEHRLSTKAFFEITKQLNEEKISFVYVNCKYFRSGNKVLNYEKMKRDFPTIVFAIAYDEDTDEEYEGHK